MNAFLVLVNKVIEERFYEEYFMLSVVTFTRESCPVDISFVNDKEAETFVVCPGPLIADNFRAQFIDLYKDIELPKTLTITEFTKEELSHFCDDVKVFRKAELLMILGCQWEKYFPDLSDEVFFQSFHYFTELRSFSTSIEVFDQFFDELDNIDISSSLKVFWAYMNGREMLDEHGAYMKVAEGHRTNDHQLHKFGDKKNFIFWGFDHLTGIQIDLLNALAIHHDIYIPFPEFIIPLTRSSDWVRWLDPDIINHIGLEEAESSRTLQYIPFSKNRLGESLEKMIPLLRDGDSDISFYLGSKDPTQNEYNEIPFTELELKCDIDLFENLLIDTFNIIEENIKAEDTLEDFKNILLRLIGDELNADNKNFRKIKVFFSLIKELDDHLEEDDSFDKISNLFLRLLKESIRLKLPRNFFIPLSHNKPHGQISTIQNIREVSEDRLSVLCITSASGKLKGESSLFSERGIGILATIAPIKRSELEFQILKEKIVSFLSQDNNYLFIENNLWTKDLAWNEIFSEFENLKIERNENEIIEENQEDILKIDNNIPIELPRIFSATSIQTYLDCPRQFYYKYVAKMRDRFELKQSLTPADLGVLEHLVIEKFIDQNKIWNNTQHENLVRETLDHFMKKEERSLDLFQYEKYLIEIRNFSERGILFLLSLRDWDPSLEIHLEYELDKKSKIKGSIDCFAKGRKGLFLFDFKRSKGGIPTINDFNTFRKIQIWFYLLHLEVEYSTFNLIGYINLSESTGSLLFAPNEDLKNDLEKFTKPYATLKVLKGELNVKMDEFRPLLQKTLKIIEDDCEFPARPYHAAACVYCPVSKVCLRGKS